MYITIFPWDEKFALRTKFIWELAAARRFMLEERGRISRSAAKDDGNGNPEQMENENRY